MWVDYHCTPHGGACTKVSALHLRSATSTRTRLLVPTPSDVHLLRSMKNTREGFHYEVELRHEAEFGQLLLSLSATQTRANSIQSQHAWISDISSLSRSTSRYKRDSIHNGSGAGSTESHERPQWTPFALRWYFIMVPAGLSLAFVQTAFLRPKSAWSKDY